MGRGANNIYHMASAVRAFDARADGTLPGDGAVAVVLKRLSDAVAQGDRIYAVICGTGAAGSGSVAPEAPEPDAATAGCAGSSPST